MTLNVQMLYEYDRHIVDRLLGQLRPGIQLSTGEATSSPADYHVLVAGRPTREMLEASSNLRWLIVPWTGIPPETRDLLLEFPHIAVHNLHHNAAPVAEMTTTLLLAAAKRVIPFDAALRNGDWSPRYETPDSVPLLSGRTALILGYGEIGRRVARILRAMGMTVLAMKRQVTAATDTFADEIHPPEALIGLLPRAEALIVTLPLTTATNDLLGARQLALLPSGCVLVNIGRGPVINQQALYEALRSGAIGAAGLDVWYNYPEEEAGRIHTAPADYPFWELENVVLSPHRSGSTSETDLLRMDHLAVLLNAAANGKNMPNKVDLHIGY